MEKRLINKFLCRPVYKCNNPKFSLRDQNLIPYYSAKIKKAIFVATKPEKIIRAITIGILETFIHYIIPKICQTTHKYCGL